MVGATTSMSVENILMLLAGLPLIIILWNKINVFPTGINMARIALILIVFLLVSDFLSQRVFGAGSIGMSLFLVPLKVAVFLYFSFIGYYKIVTLKRSVRIINIVFIVSLVFGVLQFFNIGNIGDFALKYYGLSEAQESNFLKYDRVFGTSGVIIGWSGICLIIFYYFYFIVESKSLRTIGVALSSLNIIMAGSRSGIIALIVSFIIIQMYRAFYIERSSRSSIHILAYSCIFFLGGYIFLDLYLPEQLDFLRNRFASAEESITSTARGAQFSYMMQVMNRDPFYYVFGVGPGTIRASPVRFLEIEPAHIIVSFGIVGAIIHYSLIILLLKDIFRLRTVSHQYFLFLLAITVSSLIFSFGYYFLYDRNTGLVFWWISGLIMGNMYRYKIDSRSVQINQNLG